jgi:hypothetical protein
MKKMAQDREVWKSWRKAPRRCNGTNGNGKEEGFSLHSKEDMQDVYRSSVTTEELHKFP